MFDGDQKHVAGMSRAPSSSTAHTRTAIHHGRAIELLRLNDPLRSVGLDVPYKSAELLYERLVMRGMCWRDVKTKRAVMDYSEPRPTFAERMVIVEPSMWSMEAPTHVMVYRASDRVWSRSAAVVSVVQADAALPALVTLRDVQTDETIEYARLDVQHPVMSVVTDVCGVPRGIAKLVWQYMDPIEFWTRIPAEGQASPAAVEGPDQSLFHLVVCPRDLSTATKTPEQVRRAEKLRHLHTGLLSPSNRLRVTSDEHGISLVDFRHRWMLTMEQQHGLCVDASIPPTLRDLRLYKMSLSEARASTHIIAFGVSSTTKEIWDVVDDGWTYVGETAMPEVSVWSTSGHFWLVTLRGITGGDNRLTQLRAKYPALCLTAKSTPSIRVLCMVDRD